ncbi:MAG: DUF4239 domain-containing protein [Alphaproteobacteria bacterium]
MLWLNLSLWQTFAVIVGAGVVFNGIGTLLVALFKSNAQLAHGNDPGGNKFGFLEPITGLVTVFVLTMAWIQYNDVVGRIQRETTTLVLLKESAGQFTEPTRSRVLAALAGYVEAVGGPEWRAMAANGHSEVAEQALEALVRTYGAADLRTSRDESLMRFSGPVVRRLNDDRQGRLLATTFELRQPLLVMLGAAVVVTIAFSWVFGYPTMRGKLAMGTLFTSGLMLIVFMVSVLAHPFRGPLAVPNDAYADILWEITHPEGESP